MRENEKLDREAIREIVVETIRELRRAGLLRSDDDLAYSEASSLLKSFYDSGGGDPEIAKAIRSIKKDQYYKVIPLYFQYDYTIEQIAEVFGVEISTISRNKKRLCLQIYKQLE